MLGVIMIDNEHGSKERAKQASRSENDLRGKIVQRLALVSLM
jgi:hypothetical protein